MAYTKYSLTPANNNATPPDGAPEGMLPSAVNDTMRDMMAQIRDVGDGIRDGTYTMTAAKITGGTITGVTMTASSVSATSLTDSGNLTFTGTGNRITGDFSNATLANRVLFQNSTTNANTLVGNIPNGTASGAGFIAYNSSDPSNASFMDIRAQGATDVRLTSGINGTGTYLPITMYTGGSERLRIDTSGNVGIGTSTPTGKIETVTPSGTQNNLYITQSWSVADGANYGAVIFGHDNATYKTYRSAISGYKEDDARKSGLKFFTSDTSTEVAERMRITSGGDLLVGTTSAEGRITVETGSNEAIWAKNTAGANQATMLSWNNAGSGNNYFHAFFVDAGATNVGNIDYNRGAGLTRYNTTSDATLKNIIGDSDGKKSISILNSTKIREFAWKNDSTQKPQIGVIAQELHETFAGAVMVGGEQEDGKYRPWGVDKTAFTFHLIAGWQAHEKMIKELKELVEAQAAEIALLKSK